MNVFPLVCETFETKKKVSNSKIAYLKDKVTETQKSRAGPSANVSYKGSQLMFYEFWKTGYIECT